MGFSVRKEYNYLNFVTHRTHIVSPVVISFTLMYLYMNFVVYLRSIKNIYCSMLSLEFSIIMGQLQDCCMGVEGSQPPWLSRSAHCNKMYRHVSNDRIGIQ